MGDSNGCIQVTVYSRFSTKESRRRVLGISEPIEDVHVLLRRREKSGWIDHGGVKSTDGDGIVFFDDLQAGRYRVAVHDELSRDEFGDEYSLVYFPGWRHDPFGGAFQIDLDDDTGDGGCVKVDAEYAPNSLSPRANLESISAAIEDLATYSMAVSGPGTGDYAVTPETGGGTLESIVHSAFCLLYTSDAADE